MQETDRKHVWIKHNLYKCRSDWATFINPRQILLVWTVKHCGSRNIILSFAEMFIDLVTRSWKTRYKKQSRSTNSWSSARNRRNRRRRGDIGFQKKRKYFLCLAHRCLSLFVFLFWCCFLWMFSSVPSGLHSSSLDRFVMNPLHPGRFPPPLPLAGA